MDASDVVDIGSPHPKFVYGLNTRFSYKGFDLSILASGVYGNKIYNRNLLNFSRLDFGVSEPANQLASAYRNRWIDAEHPGDGKTPRITWTDQTGFNSQGSDLYIEDGSYFRIKTITLGYNLPKNVISKFQISNLRVFATLTNFFTFTDYSWYDPDLGDTNDSSSGTTSIGVDNATYPSSKMWQCGLNISF
ncbi:MAG: hypothetical protein HC905_26530 [Bacteroidales bacterium]|nr:hypothetical protein [Bacteroidales bacterium]